ncbi:hypothetical protein FCM35_KLT16634 [Carex littledalei]|uniref:Uncharacterized protein n=1 Tax=Carex littledalei TaxID=544730 RepID=A0A833VX50_9POAL|nr:hypothetical protein FCM35_KLT16634 [Carex littledalei]
MDLTGIEDLRKPVTGEAAIAGTASPETMHHDNSPLVTTGDTDEATSDGASSIIQTLYLVQVIYLVFTGIIALLLALFNIVAFAVLVVAFFGYFGLFWYNIASSGRTRENASALAIRSFSVAAVLGASSLSATNNLQYPSHYFLIFPDS